MEMVSITKLDFIEFIQKLRNWANTINKEKG